MKLAVPDMISNSYFPAIAAIELGLFKEEGLDVCARADLPGRQMRTRRCAMARSISSAARRIRRWPRSRSGRASSCCARRRRACTGSWSCTRISAASAATSSVVKGRSIGAAPWVEMGLRRLLIEAGIDLARDQVKIAPVPGAQGAGVNFGVTAAKALEERKIDGFWANGMGAEVAVRRGVGTMVLDVRRGDGPKPCFNYTMASIATTDRLIERSPETAAAAVRAMVKTHAALKADVSRATQVGRKLFPPSEAELIAELIRRDLPYYDPTISRDFVAGMNQFARDVGILKGDVPYERVVATQFSHLWNAT